jgi:mono/diheme cytochrome c family protein
LELPWRARRILPRVAVLRFVPVFLLLLVLVAGPAEAGDVERGRAIAQDNCSRCHAIGSQGDSPFEPAPPFRDVVQKWPPTYLAEALGEGIVVGHPDMPEFTFSDTEIDDLIAYLESLQAT